MSEPNAELAPFQERVNKKLLEKVAELIIAHPEHVDMGDWLSGEALYRAANEEDVLNILTTGHSCGTTACIAGWVVAYLGKRISNDTAFDDARDALRLTEDEAERLLLAHEWPEEYLRRHMKTDEGTPEYAQLVADRIHHFIKTGE